MITGSNVGKEKLMYGLVAAVARRWARRGATGWVPAFATRADYRRFEERMRRAVPSTEVAEPFAGYLAEVEANGICVVENFWSPDTCAQARAEVDRVIAQYPQYVNARAKADRRVYGANNASALVD